MAEKTLVLSIEGMNCEHCVKAITATIRKIDGVQDVAVSLAASNATVTFDDARVSLSTIAAAVQNEGFTVTPQS